jgi:PAS domain S-box-containing protein
MASRRAAASVSVRSPVAPTPFSVGIGWDWGSQWLSSVHHILTGRITLQGRIHPDDQDIVGTLFSTSVEKPAGSFTDSFNLRLRHANGRILCVKGHFRKCLDASRGSPVLELRLHDARSLQRTIEDDSMLVNFKAIMDNTDDFIFFKDRKHVFTGASQTLVHITDPSEHRSDLLGKTDYDVFPEEYADVYHLLEKQVFAGARVAHEVQEYITNDGHKGWVDNRKYPIRDANGEVIGPFGIARDVSEHERAEQALRSSEHLLSPVIHEMPDVLVLKDHKGGHAVALHSCGHCVDGCFTPQRNRQVRKPQLLATGLASLQVQGRVRHDLQSGTITQGQEAQSKSPAPVFAQGPELGREPALVEAADGFDVRVPHRRSVNPRQRRHAGREVRLLNGRSFNAIPAGSPPVRGSRHPPFRERRSGWDAGA